MTSTGLSRIAKPVGYYVSSPPIDRLIDKFGAYLEKTSAQQKCLMAAALLDHMAAVGCDYYPIDSSLETVDPDGLLGAELRAVIVEIADASDARELNFLVAAIVDQHTDDIRNGAYDA